MGKEWKKHKYIAKEKISDKKTLYFYTQAALDAFRNKGKEIKDTLKSETKELLSVNKKAITVINKYINKKTSQITKTKINAGRKIIKGKYKIRLARFNRKEKRMAGYGGYRYYLTADNAKREKIITQRAKREKQQENHFKNKEDRETKVKQKKYEKNLNNVGMKEIERYWSYGKDAKDSVKEDHTVHPEIKLKNYKSTKDEDMFNANNLGSAMYLYKRNKYEENPENLKNADAYEQQRRNCAYAVLAYDMRRRGYDVTALDMENDAINRRELLTELHNDISYDDVITVKFPKDKRKYNRQVALRKLENKIIENNPEGSYGYITFNWDGGENSHVAIWSKEDGKIVIRDPQVNGVNSLKDYQDRAYKFQVVRVDNKPLSPLAYETIKKKEKNTV